MKFSYQFRFFAFMLFVSLALLSKAQNASFIMTQIGPNEILTKPWDLEYGPDDFLWVTERTTGIVTRVNPETGERDDLLEIPDLSNTHSQNGLLGMALDDGLLSDNPYVYLSYSYLDQGEQKQKLVRYIYTINGGDGSLSSPIVLIDNLPCSNDHNSGRLVFGPDEKLYYTIGDQGSNQGGNFCNPILSQNLPTQAEIAQEDWSNYPGKFLRLNTDGSIPSDNPVLDGVQSHIYSYGHRNAQGIVFGSNGSLYSSEHGPKTDDEVNLILSGKNYGWPNVVGYQDDQAYDYCNWTSVSNCEELEFSNDYCDPTITPIEESSFVVSNYQEPIQSMFAVSDDYNFENPDCGNPWICWPNVAPSSIAIYESDAIPSWNNSLLVTSLKRGRVYLLKLNESGSAVVGDTIELFYTANRYRDIVVDPDGKSFYVITDFSGTTSDASGLNPVSSLANKGSILKFTLDESVDATAIEKEATFEIWPNPTSDKLFITLKDDEEPILNAALFDVTGKLVKQFNTLQLGVNEINTSNFSNGIYFMKLYSENNAWIRRVIIHH